MTVNSAIKNRACHTALNIYRLAFSVSQRFNISIQNTFITIICPPDNERTMATTTPNIVDYFFIIHFMLNLLSSFTTQQTSMLGTMAFIIISQTDHNTASPLM